MSDFFPVNPLLVAALYYVLARAEVTRWLWFRYPKWLDELSMCPACSGFWIGFVTAACQQRIGLFGFWLLFVAFTTLSVRGELRSDNPSVGSTLWSFCATILLGGLFLFVHGHEPVVHLVAGPIRIAIKAGLVSLVTTPILFGLMRGGLPRIVALEPEPPLPEEEPKP